jgi:type II secretory pathway pseudopilin PulG
LELVIVVALIGALLAVAFTRWQGYTAQQRLRYGTAQVATDLRQAQERAKAERIRYTVAFTTASAAYTIARSGGGFIENTSLPAGVTVETVTPSLTPPLVVTFSAFGTPIDPDTEVRQAYTVTVRNAAGTRTITVTASGGITYQEP